MRHALLAVSLAALLLAQPALSADCTHDLAVRAISVLDGTTGTGFPTLPSDAADMGPDAGIPYIETLPADALARMTRNTTAAQHWVDALRLALAGQCGDPLVPDERKKAVDLVGRFDPWIAAWQGALPAEQQRRGSDKAEAVSICESTMALSQAQSRLAFEKSNPSGVVDLQELHTTGQQIQVLTQIISARKRLFQRDRGKPFAPAMCTAKK
jgi:hypothetical protein